MLLSWQHATIAGYPRGGWGERDGYVTGVFVGCLSLLSAHDGLAQSVITNLQIQNSLRGGLQNPQQNSLTASSQLTSESLARLGANTSFQNAKTGTLAKPDLVAECAPPHGFVPIYSRSDFAGIRENPQSNYFLCNDLDFSIAGESSFERIPTFNGTLDGNNKAIVNYTHGEAGCLGTSLFGVLEGATIKSLRIENFVVEHLGENGAAAALASIARESLIENVYLNNISVTAAFPAGVVMEATNTQLKNITLINGDLTIKGGFQYGGGVSGGIVGYLIGDSLIDGAVVQANLRVDIEESLVSFWQSHIGGIVGVAVRRYGARQGVQIINSLFTGGIESSARGNAGGMVGFINLETSLGDYAGWCPIDLCPANDILLKDNIVNVSIRHIPRPNLSDYTNGVPSGSSYHPLLFQAGGLVGSIRGWAILENNTTAGSLARDGHPYASIGGVLGNLTTFTLLPPTGYSDANENVGFETSHIPDTQTFNSLGAPYLQLINNNFDFDGVVVEVGIGFPASSW